MPVMASVPTVLLSSWAARAVHTTTSEFKTAMELCRAAIQAQVALGRMSCTVCVYTPGPEKYPYGVEELITEVRLMLHELGYRTSKNSAGSHDADLKIGWAHYDLPNGVSLI